MESILEQQRKAHEEIERLEQAIVDQFMNDPKSVNALSGTSEFSEFYGRLKAIKDYHRRYPNETVEPLELEFISQTKSNGEEDDLDKLFSGEEGSGRFLDLHALHEQYVNLKNVKKIDYLTYLSEFDNFADYSRENKHGEYIKYLEELRSYLESFFKRVKPLSNLEDIQETTQKNFLQQWESGKFPGWERQIGSDEDNGLFCAACRKGYTKQTVFDAHLKSKKHIKAASAMIEQGITSVDRETQEKLLKEAAKERDKREVDIAFTEALIRKYAEILSMQREDTKANVERKRALTDREQAEEVDDIESESEDEDKIYNPLKLPLGWDGKPIPYWLYKLHGLGVEYPCEICGNYVYMGRKAFDRHFQVI
ncbi:3533_t:CDS:2 [Racocetra fulgida]|uniref:3533_t:CDS:1 n=1 Tax=Racocetra fulgida TaxID=60492 RepID=A0A9N9F5I2_9GLOM|nr:3533_t:CDS:2 [Racocetra fulgida]